VPADGVVPHQYFEVDPGRRLLGRQRSADEPQGGASLHGILKPRGASGCRPRTEGSSAVRGRHRLWCCPTVPRRRCRPAYPSSRCITRRWARFSDRLIGLVLADPRRFAGRYDRADRPELRIPPHAAAHRIEREYRCPADSLPFGLFPHTQAGKSFRYEATYPTRRRNPAGRAGYDFNWQHCYELAEPKRLPKGTVPLHRPLRQFAGNPANLTRTRLCEGSRRPTMFRGHFEVARRTRIGRHHRCGRLSRFVSFCCRWRRSRCSAGVCGVGSTEARRHLPRPRQLHQADASSAARMRIAALWPRPTPERRCRRSTDSTRPGVPSPYRGGRRQGPSPPDVVLQVVELDGRRARATLGREVLFPSLKGPDGRRHGWRTLHTQGFSHLLNRSFPGKGKRQSAWNRARPTVCRKTLPCLVPETGLEPALPVMGTRPSTWRVGHHVTLGSRCDCVASS
jgi:hypothetical protein